MTVDSKMEKLIRAQKELLFSGAFYACRNNKVLTGSHGFSNRSEQIKNKVNTRFAIASGSKIFTSVAICMLVESGKLSFDTTLKDCLDIDLKYVDDGVTIHHLLTHTSGVPDYFDEEIMDDYEELWESRPMYQMKGPRDFLSMFQNKKMQANVGSEFHYNNSGYILLGLIIEKVAKCSFVDFIEEHILRKIGMKDSGYFAMDCLPERAALGYIDEEDDNWRTNIYSLPIKGGPDGGAFVTVTDMAKFWQAVMTNQLLSGEMTRIFLKPREAVVAEDNIYYGYSGYMEIDNHKEVVQFIQMGYDPGVNFRAVHVPKTETTIIICSNESEGAYELLKEVEKII